MFYTSAITLKGSRAQCPGPKGLVFRKDACVRVNQFNKANYFWQCFNAFCFSSLTERGCHLAFDSTKKIKTALKCPYEPRCKSKWPLWPCLNGSDEESTQLWIHACCFFCAWRDASSEFSRLVVTLLQVKMKGGVIEQWILHFHFPGLERKRNVQTPRHYGRPHTAALWVTYNTIHFTCRRHDSW